MKCKCTQKVLSYTAPLVFVERVKVNWERFELEEILPLVTTVTNPWHNGFIVINDVSGVFFFHEKDHCIYHQGLSSVWLQIVSMATVHRGLCHNSLYFPTWCDRNRKSAVWWTAIIVKTLAIHQILMSPSLVMMNVCNLGHKLWTSSSLPTADDWGQAVSGAAAGWQEAGAAGSGTNTPGSKWLQLLFSFFLTLTMD